MLPVLVILSVSLTTITSLTTSAIIPTLTTTKTPAAITIPSVSTLDSMMETAMQASVRHPYITYTKFPFPWGGYLTTLSITTSFLVRTTMNAPDDI